MDEQTMKLGLLVEAAETHQQLVGAMLTKLRQHAEGIDAAVRDEIRRTLLEEIRGVQVETQRAVQSLRRIQRAANLRVAFWSVGNRRDVRGCLAIGGLVVAAVADGDPRPSPSA